MNKISTKIIATKYAKPDVHGAINMPVYRNAAFEYPDSQSIADAFAFRTDLHTYSRISNPTVANFEAKIQQASGAENVMALASGMAAISNTFLTIASAGNNIVSSPHLFGNTFSFFRSTLASFGVEIRYVDTDDLYAVAAAIDGNTCAFFAEILTNPHLEVANLPAISAILKERGVPMILDTTVIPWGGYDREKAGVDIDVVSTTKYVSGGATSIGGAIVDYGVHDWKTNRKLSALPKPKGMSRFFFKLRSEIGRNIGAYMSPDTAYLQSLGMESLELRYERMAATASTLAHSLAQNSKIAKVHYPGLPDSPYYSIAQQLFSGNPGAMFTISLTSKSDCFRFMDGLQIIRRATNLFDNKTLVIHPESTIYATFPPELKRLVGIDDTLIRFSVGLEEASDLLEDIEKQLSIQQ
ncbi:MAG: PLP-dependent transferase [Tannerella sp.]|jgi:O-acetylhomoserine (thiol)-lyase|nr:PLP-dependent transferase [Tannerella sp.]